MKIKVRIEDREFEVEVGDLQSRPIVAVVDGEQFEVWPEEASIANSKLQTTNSKTPTPNSNPNSRSNSNSLTVLAPIPGVIVAVAVGPGAVVQAGQELCVIEAMKMKNAIRANRAGTIVAVRVSAGQTVKHKDVLAEFAE
ncbi:MAG: acetyl-CoA carboxylase biotin carboxyl carrier protein subunit [Chloroflexi bacterium]|nr:acetyl-CoA carboxylase biotin carboxyl carrier protein subunit [Chloroflexota bacterium]